MHFWRKTSQLRDMVLPYYSWFLHVQARERWAMILLVLRLEQQEPIGFCIPLPLTAAWQTRAD